MKIFNLKIITINLLIFSFFILICEIILGKWTKNFANRKNYTPIIGLVRDKEIIYKNFDDNSKNKILFSRYYRDAYGYRSRSSDINKKIILTIGSSTTDQVHTTEGKTWHDILDDLNNDYDFINGGISGHTSYTHLNSIDKWHSKIPNKDSVKLIIFYTGPTDRKLMNNDYLKLNNKGEFSIYGFSYHYLKQFLKDNSFFIEKFLFMKNNLVAKNKKISISLSNSGKKYSLNSNLNDPGYIKYQKLILTLIEKTKSVFPSARILFIQEEIPACKFINENEVINLGIRGYDDGCLELLKVYKLQNILIETKDLNIDLVPMYLKSIIGLDGVYDDAHSNNKGSQRIAEFINTVLLEKKLIKEPKTFKN